MNIKSLRICFVIGLLALSSCSTEVQSTKTPGNSDPNSNSETETASNAPRFQFAMEAGASWVTKSMETTTMTANPGTKNEAVTKLEVTINRKFSMDNIDKENAMNLHVIYVDVKVKYDDGGESWTYNSNNPKGRTNALGFESLAGNELDVRINPATGQVIGVRGGETIYAILGRDELADLANGIFVDRFNQELYVYPDGPTDIGNSWTRSYNVAAPYGLKYTHTYTLDKQNNGQGFFKRESEIESGEMPVNLYSDRRKFDLKGSATANLNVDATSGLIYSLVSNAQLSGSQTLPAPPGGSDPVTTPISLKIDLISEMTMK